MTNIDFNDADSVYVNDKEVESVLLNDNLVWEKNAFTYICSNLTELDAALTNAVKGDSIYIENGTYTLAKSYNIPCITIVGQEDNPPILTMNDKFISANSSESGVNIFENLQFRGAIGGINSNSEYASVEVRNCGWKNMVNQYNFHAIRVSAWNDNKYVLVEDCEFINNYTTGYGHFCTNIHCIAPNGPKNLTVRNCVFNATRNNGTNNVQGGSQYRVAMNVTGEWINSLSYKTPVNCYFCNNQYLHANDTLYGFTRSNCP